MRKLKLQMQISVDGEIEGYVLALMDTADTILPGRKLAVDYIPYWETEMTKADSPMQDLAQRIVRAGGSQAIDGRQDAALIPVQRFLQVQRDEDPAVLSIECHRAGEVEPQVAVRREVQRHAERLARGSFHLQVNRRGDPRL